MTFFPLSCIVVFVREKDESPRQRGDRVVRTGYIKKKGDLYGVIVREDETLECPRYRGVDGKGVTIVVTENGEIVAVRDSEVTWIPR